MKKLLIASLLTLSAIPAFASKGNIYVQGDLGYSEVSTDREEINGEKINLSNKSFTQRLSVGYNFGNGFRVAGDFTNFANIKGEVNILGINVDYTAKIKSFGISAFYDFANSTRFTPYLGTRLSYNHGSMNVSTNVIEVDVSKSSTGFGVLGGIQTKLTNNLSINTGLEYNRLFSDVNQFGANLGLSYNF
ncbi:hypothetical protein CEP48_03840 [Mergibacter septicus]|uniref:Uncharacterized protein n=1 Tax=Mergibacter septicus TaxID=221402 RepID=A0A8D4IZZ6_9PAST|nr:opacity family porin [Mergibacter septicus]AWX13404.1 hypothetical protein CEP49_01985 [Mergibacter septicus]AWX15349.1 hypothetical protein CEP47_03840 [Mergibacter septicus]QDJ12826.1 hypothetical protein CEP45_02745 [Mergibacter septicus]QDJ14603.1 hypothetical protein CEP48_03840 [Mergibacter septicus]UTU47963.1 outer membrane beta-barrel protein [Mergibacter septicus]